MVIESRCPFLIIFEKIAFPKSLCGYMKLFHTQLFIKSDKEILKTYLIFYHIDIALKYDLIYQIYGLKTGFIYEHSTLDSIFFND